MNYTKGMEVISMEKYRAIPVGYMTVGEVAKKMDITVRALQYYDKEGVLSPSSESEGGRRLYTHKDIVKLHQIQSMKYLGFSLEDIKTRLPSLDTPMEVSSVLTEQTKGIRDKINSLVDVLVSIEKLNAEIMQMEMVNWTKYADIVFNLQSKSDSYWIVSHLGDNLHDKLRSNFDKKSDGHVMNTLNKLTQKVAKAQNDGNAPESEQGQALAKEWWDFVMETTGGDMSLLPELLKLGDNFDEGEWKGKFSFDKDFLGKALGIYCASIGLDLRGFKGEKHD
jgi:DNA-binding transcriptional MerR regulator